MKRFPAIVMFVLTALPLWSAPVAAVCLLTCTATVAQAETETADDDGEHAVSDHDHETDHGDAHEGEAGHDEHAKTPILSFDFGSAFWNLVIFLAVLAILSTFVWPNVLGGLQAREEKIREDLEAAEKANAEAQALLAGYQTKLDDAATEAQTMIAQARKDAEASGQKLIEEAKAEAAAQRERAVADIETAKRVALADLASQTSEMAMQVARGVVGRELSADDHADLINQALERMPSSN